MLYVAALLAGALIVVLLIRLKHVFFNLALSAVKLLDTLLVKDQSDVKLIVSYQLRVFKYLFLVIAVLVLCVLIYQAPLELFTYFTDQEYQGDWRYILALSAGSIIPFLPWKKKPQEDYSEWSKVLHRLILDNYELGKNLFELDRKWFNIKPSTNDTLFVSGLARAGSTAMTTQLFERGRFHSLSYANMPFLLAPNIWGVFYKPGNSPMKERSHGDKVMFGQNSVEALEEYFWKVNMDDSYIGEDSLSPHEVSEETAEKFKIYQSMTGRKSDSTTYLAKNNNMLLRYRSLRDQLPGMKVIFLFRDPVQHALSLKKQHERYKQMQEDDSFVLEYMNWLGHHEFGGNHKPILFGDESFSYEPDSINYWIEVWLYYYSAFLAEVPEDAEVMLIEYEDFADSPVEVFDAIRQFTGIQMETEGMERFDMAKRDAADVDAKLLDRATEVFNKLKARKHSPAQA